MTMAGRPIRRSTAASRKRATAFLVGLSLLLTTVSCRVSGSAQPDSAGLQALDSSTSTDTETADSDSTASETTGTFDSETPTSTDSNGTESTPGSSASTAKTVSITVQEGDPDVLIGTIWWQALTHKGYRIKLTRMSGGDIDQPLAALSAGAIDLALTYSGYALNHFRPNSSGSPAEMYQQLKQALPKNIEALPPGKAESNYAVVVTKQTATQLHLTTIGDLAKQKAVTLAVPDFWDTTKEPQKRLISGSPGTDVGRF